MLCLLGSPALAAADGVSPLRLRPKALASLARLATTGDPQDRGEFAALLFAGAGARKAHDEDQPGQQQGPHDGGHDRFSGDGAGHLGGSDR